MCEYIDVYDANRQVTGRIVAREGSQLGEGEFMLYVLAIIQNEPGEFLITQRSLDKHWAAGWWETTGGGVLAGETPEQAVVREVGEETGLDVSHEVPELLYTYENVDTVHHDNYFVNIYRFRFDFDPSTVSLQESEAIDFRLATWDQISELAEQGRFLHFNRIKLALDRE